MGFKGLSNSQKKSLEYEVVPERARLKLTRLIRQVTNANESTVKLVLQNNVINISNSVLGLPIYKLEAEDGEYYYPAEYGWHNGEIELIMRRPETIDLVEILGDLIQAGVLLDEDVNNILEDENISFTFRTHGMPDELSVKVNILPIDEIESDVSDEHPNIRLLINRMNKSLENNDPANVLHACASVFETLAKDVVNIGSIQNNSLGSFFSRYRQDSKLPQEILDYMQDIYNRRNVEPLAGHGSTQEVNITQEDAIVLAEMTKAFVRIERQLLSLSIRLDGSDARSGSDS